MGFRDLCLYLRNYSMYFMLVLLTGVMVGESDIDSDDETYTPYPQLHDVTDINVSLSYNDDSPLKAAVKQGQNRYHIFLSLS